MVRKAVLIIMAVLFGTTLLAKPTAPVITKEPVLVLTMVATDSGNRSSESISVTIDGQSLTIYINEDVGIANILVTNANGIYIDRDNLLQTPDMATLLIEDEGVYRVTITLSNGDVYYGDFQVTD